MKAVRFLPVLMSFALLAGCGAVTSGSGGGGNNGTPGLQGAWQITATSTSLLGVETLIEADFTASGGAFSASGVSLLIATIQSGSAAVCPFQGSFSGSLTGTSLSGTLTEATHSMTISGTLSGDGKSATGTYQGGCLNGDSGTFTASAIAQVTGSYSGNLTDNFGNSATVQIQLNESGNFSLTASGNVTQQGTVHNLSLTTGSVIGAAFGGTGTLSNVNGSTQIVAAGRVTPSAAAADAFAVADTNGNLLYEGTLTRTGAAAVAPAFRFAIPVPQINAKSPTP